MCNNKEYLHVKPLSAQTFTHAFQVRRKTYINLQIIAFTDLEASI